MKYLHTMVRVTDLEASLQFYCAQLGLREVRRKDYPGGRFTLVFLAAPEDEDALLISGYVELGSQVQIGSTLTLVPGTFVYNGSGVGGATSVRIDSTVRCVDACQPA